MSSRIADRLIPHAGTGTTDEAFAATGAEKLHCRLVAIGDVILRHRWTPLITVVVTILVHLVLREAVFPRYDPLAVAARACAAQGEWFALGSADVIDQSRLIGKVARRPIVLIGKTETRDLDEGRWLGFTVAALYGQRRQIVIALDAFPPSQQPLLDRWVHGEVSEAELIRDLDWRDAYTPDPQSYVPLLRLARLYRLPLLAIGVSAEAAEQQERDTDAGGLSGGIGGGHGPAEPTEGYRRSLAATLLAEKLRRRAPAAGQSHQVFSDELTPVLVSDEFRRFLKARRAEDWLLATRLAAARRLPGRPLVVGVIARDHIEYGWGVPNQLAALGFDKAAVLLPFGGGGDCTLVRPGAADAAFIFESRPLASWTEAEPRPR